MFEGCGKIWVEEAELLPKMIKAYVAFVLLLFVTACSSAEWSYRYEGKTDNWIAAAEIVPDQETGARFIGKIKNGTDKKVKRIQYQAEVTSTSQLSGKLENPVFTEGFIVLFEDIPNTDQARKDFQNGVTEEENKRFFGEYPVYQITWLDELGNEQSETIRLNFVEPK